MDFATARGIAMYTYRAQRDRFGDPVIEHAARVAAAVPADACSTAWLHEAFELGKIPVHELFEAGLNEDEFRALELLTCAPSEAYETYVLRIAHAAGEAGRLARAVKLADLEDDLAHDTMPHRAPPYAWARRHIALAQWRLHEPGEPEQLAV